MRGLSEGGYIHHGELRKGNEGWMDGWTDEETKAKSFIWINMISTTRIIRYEMGRVDLGVEIAVRNLPLYLGRTSCCIKYLSVRKA